MLPYLRSIEFGYIIPLAVKGTQKAIIDAGINVFVAKNGNGKTTFLDLIERSICSDAHAERYRSFSHKRASSEAFILSEWQFDRMITIEQELTGGGVRTRLMPPQGSFKHYTKPEYSRFLLQQIGLSLDEFQELFESLYYKRENDLALMAKNSGGILSVMELLSKLTLRETKETLQIRGQLRQLETEIRVLQQEKKALLENISEVQMILGGDSGKKTPTLSSLKDKKTKLLAEISTIEKKIEQRRKALHQLNEKHSSIVNTLNSAEDELRELIRMREKLKGEREFSIYQADMIRKELHDLQNRVEHTSYEDYLAQHPRCPLCNSNLKARAGERAKQGCPICLTPWSEIPSSTRKSILKVELSLGSSNLTDLEKELADLEKDIERKEKELLKLSEKIQKEKDLVASLRTDLVGISKQRLQEEDELASLSKSLRSLQESLHDVELSISLIRERTEAPLIKEKLDLIEASIEQKQRERQQLLSRLPEKRDVRQILSEFSAITKEVFGYALIIEPETGVVTVGANQSIRPFDSMSWGERYLTDTCFRIAVWRHLIREGAAHHGLLLLDSPEAALDEKRLHVLAELLKKYSEKITVIVTTRLESFKELLGGHELFITRSGQTSLFDFVQ